MEIETTICKCCGKAFPSKAHKKFCSTTCRASNHNNISTTPFYKPRERSIKQHWTTDKDKIKSGLRCGKCGIYFNSPHGHKVACKHCYPTLKLKDLKIYKLATNNHFGE